MNDDELDGEVDDELDDVDKLCGEMFEFKLCFDAWVLKRFDLRKKLPFPNMSPAFG